MAPATSTVTARATCCGATARTGTVAAWFMNGATVAATAVFGALPSTWTIVGDANGEILWRDSASDIALWGVQNSQVTSSSGLGTVTSNFVVQGVGDFNGDGKIDILWRDTNSGTLSIWFTNGTQVTSAGVVGTLPSNWSVAQVGDYNGDGKSDILLLDSRRRPGGVADERCGGVVVPWHRQCRDDVAGAERQYQLGNSAEPTDPSSSIASRFVQRPNRAQFLPCPLTERGAALPQKAAAPAVRRRGSYGPCVAHCSAK